MWLVLVGCYLLLTSPTTSCPYKECQCIESSIYCADQGFTHVPDLFDVNAPIYNSLNFNTNNITEIPDGSLPSLVHEFYFLENPIVRIGNGAFNNSASVLDALSFSEARLTRLPDALLLLKTLNYLTIYDTPIRDWNDQVLRQISQTLKSLVLGGVGLQEWPSWLGYFVHLSELAITSCSISSIPLGASDSLTDTLKTLTLFNNSLTVVPQAIAQLTALTILHLHHNKIANITYLPHHSRLMTLSLYNNQLTDATHMSQALVPFAASLSDLELHDNHLRSLPNLTFLTNIQSLDFSNNLLSDPTPGAFPTSINTLDLSHNFFPAVPSIASKLPFVFELLLSFNVVRAIHDTDLSKTLTGIYLGHNSISELTDNSFPVNSDIATLDLSNNPLVKISSNALTNLPRLMDINLQNSKLARLPLALAALTSVQYVDLSNNGHLVCTCVESSLRSWVENFQPFMIIGQCGVTSVYDFFKYFSSSCLINSI